MKPFALTVQLQIKMKQANTCMDYIITENKSEACANLFKPAGLDQVIIIPALTLAACS